MRATTSTLAIALLAYVLIACGGCGSGGAQVTIAAPTPLLVVLPTVAARTAWNNADTDRDMGVSPLIGDARDNTGFQGYVSFALDAIPADAGISEATLVLPIAQVFGQALGFGDLLVDATDIDRVGFAYVPQFVKAPDATGTPDPASMEVRLDVTALVRQALAAGRSAADFRLRFAIESNFDGAEDLLKLASPQAPLDAANRLEVTYR